MDLHNLPSHDGTNTILAGRSRRADIIEPLFVYGVKPDVHGGIFFAADNANLLYPAGCGIAVYNTKNRQQTLISLAERGRHITAICSNKTRNLVAFAEWGDRPHVIIFDLETKSRKKVLRCAEFASHEVISVAFSHDSKYLLAQGGSPDYSLVYFFWEKNKVITTLKNLTTGKNPITEVSFHPKSHSIICIVGNGFFKMCKLTEGVLKQFGFQKGEHYLMTCHDWLSPRHLTIGTKNGKVLLLEEAELRTTVNVYDMLQSLIAEGTSQLQMSIPTMKERSSISNFSACGSSSSSVINEEKYIHAIITYKNGFICSVGSGRVVVLELSKPLKSITSEEEINFSISTIIKLPKSNANPINKNQARNVGSKVISMAINSNETMLVALTDRLQLVCLSFKVVTCGIDKTLRIWNYLTLDMELSKEFEENVSSVALHPTGLYILAGFFDRLRLMNLLIDDIKVFYEFDIKNSNVCRFSCGGHLLAAVSSKDIEVYSSVTFKKMSHMKGHNGKITSLRFSSDDRTLVSCGNDGSIYEWDVCNHGKRKNEIVIKSCSYNDVALTDIPEEDQLTTYAVGSDKTIKQIQDSTLIRQIDLHSVVLQSVALSLECKLLFSGSTGGRIQCFQFPLTLPGEWEEYKMHGDEVTQMRLSSDSKRLVTAGKDGSLCIWHVKASDELEIGKSVESSRRQEYASEILITKSELEEKNKLVTDLQQQVDETKTESEYQLRLKDNQYEEESASKHKQFTSQITDLRQAIHKLQNTLEINNRDHSNAINALKEQNDKALIEQADQYKQKLIIEYQRFENMEEKYNALKKTFDKKIVSLEQSTKNTITDLQAKFDKKVEEKDQEVVGREMLAEEKIKAVEEVLKQTEDDADKEIVEMKTKYEKFLRIERDSNVKLRGENGVLKKKFQSLSKDSEEQRGNIQRMTNETQRLNQTIKGLEKDIIELKRELKNRDETISEREKQILDIKRNCIELEKNRYVLEHKIEDLRHQIQPKDEIILDMQAQIGEMEDELTTVSKAQTDLELQVQDSKSKVSSCMVELAAERKKSGKQAVLLSRMRKDLLDLSSMQDSKVLKTSVGKLSKKYIKSLEAASDSKVKINQTLDDQKEEEEAAIQEILRQKSFLERTVASLKDQMKNLRLNHKQEYVRKLRENQFLVGEVEELKKELKAAKGYRVPQRLTLTKSTSTDEDEARER